MAKGYPDFEGMKSKLFSVADWAALEATDKNFVLLADDKAYDEFATASYVVPAGKTLYITQLSFCSYASAAANGDANQIVRGYLTDLTIADIAFGGNGGGSVSLPKPWVITAGKTLSYVIRNMANHTCDMMLTISGYEV